MSNNVIHNKNISTHLFSMMKSRRIKIAGNARLTTLVALWGCGVCLAQTSQSPKPVKSTAPKKIVLLKPGYSLPDSARDPFFFRKVADSGPKKPELNAETLAGLLKISGLLGRPEQPEKAGLLIGTRIYRVNESIPVMLNNTVYSLVLVQVKFPGQVFLRYNDTTTVLDITPKN